MGIPWNELLRALRLADFADIFLVATILFFAIHWMRRSQAGSAARSLLAMGFFYAVFYLLGDLFNLYLLTRLLQVLFFLVLIAIVVVFQTDIRILLDRMSRWKPGRPAPPQFTDSPVPLLLEAVAKLANDYTGALIALRGRESWDSHLQGGVPLNGNLSLPLIYSIFQVDTPGHDGALLIIGNNISRFAVHLPLAMHLPEESRFGGTRHAAALGLAERCDALVIVVSEETGAVSVAENGAMRRMGSPDELAERLYTFWERHHPRPGSLRKWDFKILTSALLALSISAFSWFLLVFSADIVTRTYSVPLELRNLPIEWRIANDSLPSIQVTLSGPEPAFNRLTPENLRASFEMSSPSPGNNELVIDRDRLSLPSGVRLIEATPQVVHVTAERQRLHDLPIRIRLDEPLPDSVSLLVSPEKIAVRLPLSLDSIPSHIESEVIPLISLSSTPREVTLVIPPFARLAPDQVAQVRVSVQQQESGVSQIFRLPGDRLRLRRTPEAVRSDTAQEVPTVQGEP